MVQYDPGVLQSFAEKVYVRANVALVTAVMICAVIGSAFGIYACEFVQTKCGIHRSVVPFIGGLIGIAVGTVLGQQKAFMLRMAAQQTLCQVQIEANTRRMGDTRRSE